MLGRLLWNRFKTGLFGLDVDFSFSCALRLNGDCLGAGRELEAEVEAEADAEVEACVDDAEGRTFGNAVYEEFFFVEGEVELEEVETVPPAPSALVVLDFPLSRTNVDKLGLLRMSFDDKEDDIGLIGAEEEDAIADGLAADEDEDAAP